MNSGDPASSQLRKGRDALYQRHLQRAKCRVKERIRGFSPTELDLVFGIIANYRLPGMCAGFHLSSAKKWLVP
jgi:hypothetical protein